MIKLHRLVSCVFIYQLILIDSLAHEGSAKGGFGDGFVHPVVGLDHLLAMICVGLLSVWIGGKTVWTAPSFFVATMLAGALAGIRGVEIAMVEEGIAFSVMVLGACLAFGKSAPTLVFMVIVGIFGFFHGMAHGMEMPAASDPFLFASGFMFGSASIHLTGVGVGFFAFAWKFGKPMLRLAGVLIALVGVAFMQNV